METIADIVREVLDVRGITFEEERADGTEFFSRWDRHGDRRTLVITEAGEMILDTRDSQGEVHDGAPVIHVTRATPYLATVIASLF